MLILAVPEVWTWLMSCTESRTLCIESRTLWEVIIFHKNKYYLYHFFFLVSFEYVVWALSFDQLKGGCGTTIPLSLRKFPLQKLWIHFDKRELQNFESTKFSVDLKILFLFQIFFQLKEHPYRAFMVNTYPRCWNEHLRCWATSGNHV